METLLLPFSPRFIILTICAVATALLVGIGIVDHKPMSRTCTIPRATAVPALAPSKFVRQNERVGDDSAGSMPRAALATCQAGDCSFGRRRLDLGGRICRV